MAWFNLRQWFSRQTPHSQDEKLTCDETSPKKKTRRSLLCYGVLTLMCILYGVILLMLLMRNFKTMPRSENCTSLLEPLNNTAIRKIIFLGTWVLQEAYSSDPIDRYALTHSKSSWAKFYQQPGDRVYLHMGHRLYSPQNGSLKCVYHHFPNLTIRNSTLKLRESRHNSFADIQFLRACNECLVMSATAYVKDYPTLSYLLVYGLHQNLHPYYLIKTREQASCKKLMPPAPYKYTGKDFCPSDGRVYNSSPPYNPLLNMFGFHPDKVRPPLQANVKTSQRH